jgi:hypothetical protein
MGSNTNKTAPTAVSVDDFLATVSEQRQQESREIIAIMQNLTGEPPVMWGPSIIGFGTYHYTYESGREGDSPLAGFSPRKANLVVYLTAPMSRYETQLATLGPHTTSKVCLYIKRLSAVDLDVLREIIVISNAAAGANA